MRTVFFAFRDAPERRAALASTDSLDRYRLFGLDEIGARGVRVRHNLEVHLPPWARAVDIVVNRALGAAGGYGGDFATVLAPLQTANRSDVVLATNDTVGLPLVLLKRAGLLRSPLVYVAIGLPERLAQLHGRTRRLYAQAFRRAYAVVAYSEREAQWLREWTNGAHVVFVPFGVDVKAFAPDGESDIDVVSVGADPQRDFQLLCELAERHPELRFALVASADHARALGRPPANVALETDVPLERVRDRLAQAKVVALPVRRNSYSGATTVLLQAMALGKPVVVSRTDAIAQGYELQDGVNCRLVPPGDVDAFERALLETLDDAGSLGTNARRTVVRSFTWQRYTDRLWEILSAAWAREGS